MKLRRQAAPLARALGFSSAVFAPTAHAQTYAEARTDAGIAVVFEEDVTTRSTLDARGSLLRAPSAAFRTGLVRPRLNFVSEMLKSVEAL